MKQREYEYVVVGLGGIGSAAAYWLAQCSRSSVLGIEQFELGHVRGESQDHSRMIRLSYHAPTYVELARLAYDAWEIIEREAGEPLVRVTGGLELGPRGSPISLTTYMESLTMCGVPFEYLDATEIVRRWPQFTLPDHVHGLYQQRGGIVMAARANAAHQRLARAYGATLEDRTPVERIETGAGEFTITAGGAHIRCRRVVIAAGPWSNSVLRHFGLELPLQVTREQVTYFASPNLAAFSHDRFPVWSWLDDPCYYGFPVCGEPAIKAAQDAAGTPTTADTRDFEPDPTNLAGVIRFLSQYIPCALGPVHATKTCLYTLTPDRDFVIDTIPGHAGAVVAIGAGHAFKFASLIGRILADLTIDGRTSVDLSPFGLQRRILQMRNPSIKYVV